MKTLDPDPWKTILAGSSSDGTAITVQNYADMHKQANREEIAKLIYRRFNERYLDPVLDNPNRHGFSILAIGCLMIESL